MNRESHWLLPAGVPGSGDTSIALVTLHLPVAVRLPNGLGEPRDPAAGTGDREEGDA
jgi:hypothetical protein